MGRISQNTVLVVVSDNRTVVPHQSKNELGEKVVELRDLQGNIVPISEVTALNITDMATAKQFIEGHLALPVPPKSGYDKYFSTEGPINPKSPLGLDSQSALKNALIFVNAMVSDTDTAAVENSVAVLAEYLAIAKVEVEKFRKASQEAKLIADATRLGISPEQIQALVAPKPVETPTVAPVATVEPTPTETPVVETVKAETAPVATAKKRSHHKKKVAA